MLLLLVWTLIASADGSQKDFYEVLGLDKDCAPADIKKAYRKLAMQWHPDKNPDNREEALVRFKAISEAYETLSDPSKRKAYDSGGGSGGWGGGGDWDFGSANDLFKDFFSGEKDFDWSGFSSFGSSTSTSIRFEKGKKITTTSQTIRNKDGTTKTTKSEKVEDAGQAGGGLDGPGQAFDFSFSFGGGGNDGWGGDWLDGGDDGWGDDNQLGGGDGWDDW